MLPRARRIHRSAEFRPVVRTGMRASSRHLVVYLLPAPGQQSRAGLIVSKSVGGSVVRHRVSRRLRHLLADRLRPDDQVLIVVRALPASSSASSAELAISLDQALASATRRIPVGQRPGTGLQVSQ